MKILPIFSKAAAFKDSYSHEKFDVASDKLQ
jgi:hypothetical protein